MRRLLTLTIALTLAGAAQAAPQTSGLAVQRQEVVALDSRRMTFAGQRVRLETELDGLSTEIAALKSKSGSLLGGGALDAKLVRSRELSAQIDALREQEGQVLHKLERKAEALLGAYDAQVAEVRATLEGAKGQERQAALTELARLEQERSQVRAGLDRLSPDARGYSDHKLERTGALGHKLEREGTLSHKLEKEDPDSLRAEADRLRDTRDRLLRRIKQLQRRSDELRAQAELEVEMRSFQAETSLFDETDFSVVRMTSTVSRAKGGALEATSADTGGPGDYAAGGGAPAPNDGTAENGDPTAGAFSLDGDTSRSSGEATTAAVAGYDDTEAYFQLGRQAGRAENLEAAGALLLDEGEGSSETLESRQAEMKRLAERLEARAKKLDAEASGLER
ncbi:MAG: hypothetical protein P1V51_15540 [Deltaproteobacteria bacterium]|nr:hypothetical protein [Deltaproteobacteria bacterium]